jgi:hypothetical protein
MAEASRRAARPERKGGRPNALFLAGGVEALDPVLDGCADLVTVTLPWGSLLRAALGIEAADVAAGAIARLPKRSGRVELLVSVAPRDGIPGVPCLDDGALARVAARHAELGLCLVEARPATAAELRATPSTWAKRLLAGGNDRDVWRLVLLRMNPA